MSETEIIKLIFGIFLTVDTIALLTLAFALSYKYVIQEQRCTARVKGTVKKYTLASRGEGVHLPVVFYCVNGNAYKVVGPEYKQYKIVTKKSLVSSNNTEFEEDGQTLIIKRTVNSAIGAMNNPMAVRYPLETELDVYYDPNNPKLAYVSRYCNKKWMFYLFLSAAAIIFAIDMLIVFTL